jgi:mannitol/fructose-specific phosphotransferase system IIA component (Ntr-type)
MKLGDLIKPDLVLMNFDATDKWEAIESLVDVLVGKGRISDEQRQPILDALIAREGIASTGMENGVALPHASVDILDEAVACVAISRDGVPFESADESLATILILLVIPRHRVQQHIRTLAAIARLLNVSEMREALLACDTADCLVKVIRDEEEVATGGVD